MGVIPIIPYPSTSLNCVHWALLEYWGQRLLADHLAIGVMGPFYSNDNALTRLCLGRFLLNIFDVVVTSRARAGSPAALANMAAPAPGSPSFISEVPPAPVLKQKVVKQPF